MLKTDTIVVNVCYVLYIFCNKPIFLEKPLVKSMYLQSNLRRNIKANFAPWTSPPTWPRSML